MSSRGTRREQRSREAPRLHRGSTTDRRWGMEANYAHGDGLPPPGDIDDRQEGYKAYDVATDVLGTIECVLEDDLRSAIETLLRSATITDDELAQEHRGWLKRKIL